MNRDDLTLLLTMLRGGGGGLAAPTEATISGSVVIGQTLTASATGTVTSWQWKRGGSDIGGATNSTYVLVDADFGYAITVVATNALGSATSAATGLVAEAPAQSLGAELITNGDFSAWTGDNPTSWTVSGESGSDPMVTQVAANGSAGTGAARLYSSATIFVPVLSTGSVMTIGNYYECYYNVSAHTSGAYVAKPANASGIAANTGAALVRLPFRANHAQLQFQNWSTLPGDFVLDTISLKETTLNGQLVAPSANMRITQLYTLSGSPEMRSQIDIMLRISDFSAGNYWIAVLEYTGAQWDITLFSVATHTRTSRIAATNIGATNGIRINANGSNWTLQTTANGGANWTSRGTVTNATYNTATGVNALWTSGFAAGNLTYEAAA